jgi:hypothetical protein
MKFCLSVCIIFLAGINFVFGKVSPLLVTTIGEGVVQIGSNSPDSPISASQFLPKSVKLSVRPKSGIETLASGFQFRFGSSTTFLFEDDSIEMFNGSLFVRSRNFINSLKIIGPEFTVVVSGAGTCLLDVEPNGGFKIVGLLGNLRISGTNQISVSVLPGELIFTDIKNNKFSDKVVVDLANLLDTSFLISGFSNSSSFEKSLLNVSASQKSLIGKSFNAKVGNATSTGKFQISPIVSNEEANPDDPSFIPEGLRKNYQPTNSSPLHELLGREPARSSAPSTVIKHGSPHEKKLLPPPTNRPLPGGVLRGVIQP